MDLSLFFLAFTIIWKISSGIRCYKCVPEPLFDAASTPVCDHFDASERFVVECPFSTMCFKKETTLDSLGLTTTSYQRGCAQQTMDGEQEKIRGKWTSVKKIHEVYSEGCQVDSSESGRPTRTTHCYCRGALCNSARRLARSWGGMAFVIITWTVFK